MDDGNGAFDSLLARVNLLPKEHGSHSFEDPDDYQFTPRNLKQEDDDEIQFLEEVAQQVAKEEVHPALDVFMEQSLADSTAEGSHSPSRHRALTDIVCDMVLPHAKRLCSRTVNNKFKGQFYDQLVAEIEEKYPQFAKDGLRQRVQGLWNVTRYATMKRFKAGHKLNRRDQQILAALGFDASTPYKSPENEKIAIKSMSERELASIAGSSNQDGEMETDEFDQSDMEEERNDYDFNRDGIDDAETSTGSTVDAVAKIMNFINNSQEIPAQKSTPKSQAEVDELVCHAIGRHPELFECQRHKDNSASGKVWNKIKADLAHHPHFHDRPDLLKKISGVWTKCKERALYRKWSGKLEELDYFVLDMISKNPTDGVAKRLQTPPARFCTGPVTISSSSMTSSSTPQNRKRASNHLSANVSACVSADYRPATTASNSGLPTESTRNTVTQIPPASKSISTGATAHISTSSAPANLVGNLAGLVGTPRCNNPANATGNTQINGQLRQVQHENQQKVGESGRNTCSNPTDDKVGASDSLNQPSPSSSSRMETASIVEKPLTPSTNASVSREASVLPESKTLPLPEWLKVVDFCKRTNHKFRLEADSIIFTDRDAPDNELRLPLDRVSSL